MNLFLEFVFDSLISLLGLFLIAAIGKVCWDKLHGKSIPKTLWQPFLYIALCFAGGVVLVVTHGHDSKTSMMFVMVAIMTRWPGMWRDYRKRVADRKNENYGH